jgi:DNA-directed RNA polymerase specialized sigma24 family protein
VKVQLGDRFDLPDLIDRDVLAVHEGLDELEKFDARSARVIELRFFGGLDEDAVAEVLGISPSTAKRDWAFGRAWLIDYLRGSENSNQP